MSKTILLLVVIDLILIHTVDSNNVHYIKTTQCPAGEFCLTLSILAANSNKYLNSNTTIVFLEGSHILDSGLVVSNIDGSLTLSTNGPGTAAIFCNDSVSLEFSNINQLQISELEFIGCSSKVELVELFTLEDSKFHSGNDSALHLTHTNSSIVRSSFTSNTAGTYQSHVQLLAYINDSYDFNSLNNKPYVESTSARVGGALIVTSSTVNISSCHFGSNTAIVGGAIFSQSGSNMTISNCTFISNTAKGCSDDRCNGGALFIDSGCTITAYNSNFINNTASFSGGAIALFKGIFLDSIHNVFISNRAGGYGGAMYASSSSSITVCNSSLDNNEAGYGGVMSAFSSSSITVCNSSFDNNEAGYGGVMSAFFGSRFTVGNSSFDSNVASHSGGVMDVYSSSIVTVGNSSFNYNQASKRGAVMNAEASSSITVGNSSFDNNEAAYGGVMSASLDSRFTVGNSSFDHNVAGNDGGVMFVYVSSIITVGNSSFDNNVAGDDGGVISASHSSITVGNSSFDNNVAGVYGGVISASHSSITVGNSSFDNNEADYGGVIDAAGRSSITVRYSSFDHNVAGNHGGVMDAVGSSSITVVRSSFDHNVAGNDGGVMFAYASSIITVGNSSFDNNVAGDGGGVMSAIVKSNFAVRNSYFDNNTAGYGGVMSTDLDCIITVGNSSFDNNQASNKGGVVSAKQSSRITVVNSYFDNNRARNEGGVMTAEIHSRITVGNSFFDNNMAGYGGVMYANFSSIIAVGNSSFDNNVAGRVGGVMDAYSSSSFTVVNSSFDNNQASTAGGVMYAEASSKITVGHSSFNNNKVRYNGGVMYAIYNGRITVSNSSFNNNEANNEGGVLHAAEKSSITVGNSFFYNNIASKYGGVMHATQSSSIAVGNSSFYNNEADIGGVLSAWFNSIMTVDNSSFNNNKAHYDGGALFVYNRSSITVGNSSFDNNIAKYSGGVMRLSLNSSITVSNSSLENNKADNDGGVVYAKSSSSITVGNSSFVNNEAGRDGGVISAKSGSCITVGNSSFDNNEASYHGGVMHAYYSRSITVGNCSFGSNRASNNGGVVYVYKSIISTIFKNSCMFFNNSAYEGGVVYVRKGSFKDMGNMYFGNTASNGGVLILLGGDVNIMASSFVNNTARNTGGILYVPNDVHKDHITLAVSTFYSNQASSGGVITLLGNDNLTITESVFSYNNAAIRGGAIYLLTGHKLTVEYSNFSWNSANSDGGVIYSEDQNILSISNSTLNFNSADNNGGVLCSLFQTELTISGENCTFVGNQGNRGGVIHASESKINVYSRTLLMANNRAIDSGGAVHLSSSNMTFFSEHNRIVGNVAKSGGAIHASESQLIFSNGSCNFVGNQADYGGAIHANESQVVVEENSWTNVSTNLAMLHGGGLYMTVSELNAKGYSLYIMKNRANSQGGGIHAASSSVVIEGAIHLTSNEAENGGAISLERNAKLKGKSTKNINVVYIISNRANHNGGGLYVDDRTNPEMCAALTAQTDSEISSSKTECFSNSVFISFSDNSAGVSGNNLFGGLLDRCMLHTESYQKSATNQLGLASFKNSSNINESNLDTATSLPIRICFCRDGQPDCNYQPVTVQVNRGKSFSVEFIAYDQVHHAVNASIQTSLNSSAGGLGEEQEIQTIDKACTELKYNLFIPDNYEELIFSTVRAPCNNISGISERSVMIEIICSCGIGFQVLSNNDETSCECVCDRVLQSYEKTECNSTTQSIIRRENFWIAYISHTWSNSSGYVIYPNCPFDYCYTPDKQVSVNLNHPNGSDTQCDSNRTGTLCGTCKQGFSVSLGSSKCVHCPHYWPGLSVTIAIAFILSGIGLVALLLALNLTVAIGTLNAIIFYANIVATNKSALFPSGVSFASVFISWLNFDIGFDICFFDGMDTYIKTWLQLAFPAYIIILVFVIIKLSHYFDAFGCLIRKKDPVATLAILILLSYTKLLQTIITAFSSAALDYPDGSKKTLWPSDVTIECFTSKHTGLFFIAILILLVGLVYTLLLFLWQWLPGTGKWIRSQKLRSFMEIYLVPYTPRHRYWTGLLLLVRVSVYLVSAFNPSGDSRITLSATIFILTSLVVFIATFGVRMYKNLFMNTLETLTYFNIIALFIFTWYTIDADTNQTAITNISVGITFIQLTAVIIYHTYKHMNQTLFTKIQENVIIKMKEKMIQRPANTNDYNIPLIEPKPVEPTQSVVEPPNSLFVPANEAIKEKPDFESGEQESERDGIESDVIPVEENLSQENQHIINNYSAIEIADSEYDNTRNPETKMEHIEKNSIPKAHTKLNALRLIINTDIDQAQEEAVDMLRSELTGRSSTVSGEQEGVCSPCIIVEAEIHDY